MRDLSSCSVSKAFDPLAYDISPVNLISHCVGIFEDKTHLLLSARDTGSDLAGNIWWLTITE
jgi:hypothetical protein